MVLNKNKNSFALSMQVVGIDTLNQVALDRMVFNINIIERPAREAWRLRELTSRFFAFRRKVA